MSYRNHDPISVNIPEEITREKEIGKIQQRSQVTIRG